MTLSEVLSCVSKCQIPDLQDYGTLSVVCEEEFYYEIGLHYSRYEIDYFEENEEHQFIIKYLSFRGISLNSEQSNRIETYINDIKFHLGDNDPKSFIYMLVSFSSIRSGSK